MQLVDSYVYMLSRGGPLDLLFMAVTHLGPLFAIVVGRRLERLVAGSYLAWLVANYATHDFSEPPPSADAQFVWYIVFLLVTGAIALRRGAPGWTLFAAAFQLVQTATALFGLVAGISLTGFAIQSILRIWEYLFIFSLVIGAWTARRTAPAPRSAGGAPARPGAAADGAPG